MDLRNAIQKRAAAAVQQGQHFHARGRKQVTSHEHGEWEPKHTHQNEAGHDGGPAGGTREEAVALRDWQFRH